MTELDDPEPTVNGLLSDAMLNDSSTSTVSINRNTDAAAPLSRDEIVELMERCSGKRIQKQNDALLRDRIRDKTAQEMSNKRLEETMNKQAEMLSALLTRFTVDSPPNPDAYDVQRQQRYGILGSKGKTSTQANLQFAPNKVLEIPQ